MKAIRAILFRKSERYEAVPVEEKKEEEVASALIEAPQAPPEEVPSKEAARKVEKQSRPDKKSAPIPVADPSPTTCHGWM